MTQEKNMATTINSQASSLAPVDFKLSSSLEDSDEAISVAVEKCQLCGATRRPFYCKKCIEVGDFTHSKHKIPQRYSEKLQRWSVLKKERSKILHKLKGALEKQCKVDDKRLVNRESRLRIELLQQALQQAQKQRDEDLSNLKALAEKNEMLRVRSQRYVDKKRRISKYIDRNINYISQQQHNLHQLQEHLLSTRQRHIRDLLEYILPITEIQQRSDIDSSSSSMALSTISALEEARRMSFWRGRWVYTDNGGDHLYQIVEPSLPGTGDYSAYNLWVMENKQMSPVSEASSSRRQLNADRNPAYTISAALSYATHLACLLAYFLDINLPKKLCYSDFNSHELMEQQFTRLVNKLNTNVLHLCFSQNVDPEKLHPKHTIHNILMLLQKHNLGRNDAFDVNNELMLSLEEGSNQSETSDCDNSTSDEEAETAERDWEHVPVTLPEMELPRNLDPYMSTTTQVEGGDVSTMTSTATAANLMSSAAASVASFWRAATSRMDK